MKRQTLIKGKRSAHMTKRSRQNTLDDWEVELVKTLQRDTEMNDQSILAYFTRPNRTINHRLISQIRNGHRFSTIRPASKKKLQDFLDNYPLIDWATGLHLYGDELLIKAREAMLQAVQTFNNPKSFFRSELFIVSAVIAWTYLLHAYFKREGIDFRHCVKKSGQTTVAKTKGGAEKYWELSQCLKAQECPLDDATKSNLEFLIKIRNEIEHRMTSRIDNSLSAKFQACCLNFNTYIKDFFGNQLALDKDLSFSLQFAGLNTDQQKTMASLNNVPENIIMAQAKFENSMDESAYNDERYAVRFYLVPKTSNRKGKSDATIHIISPDSEEAAEANRVFLKETEKIKWKPRQIVDKMKSEGYPKFSMHHHTNYWKAMNAKEPSKSFGVILPVNEWYWYDNWVESVRDHCKKNKKIYI